jgi:hypothetical protein
MAWPSWLAPQAASSAHSKNNKAVAVTVPTTATTTTLTTAPVEQQQQQPESVGGSNPAGVNEEQQQQQQLVSKAVASPTTRRVRVSPTKKQMPLASLHDLTPGGGEAWLLGRLMRWSVDRLNAIDQSTAEAIPTLERNVKVRLYKLNPVDRIA